MPKPDWQRVDTIFAAALELPRAERANWLTQQCGDDDVLRADVEKLLRAESNSAGFLEQPAYAPTGDTDETPQNFGPYRVIRKIGQGGMGEVFLGERSDGEFEQRVAIKQLAYPTPGLLARFRQERRILAKLEHPFIARLIDGGVDARGTPYFVMEYVDGAPIDRDAADRALDLRQRIALFLDVCEAVQFAHQNLVIHRDLKPSNILVSAEAKPKLLDFGIAKVLADDDTPATRTAARLLTPDYAAPEQQLGEPITTATDVYALGVVLFELLSGTRPTSRGGEATAPPSAAIVIAHVSPRDVRGDLDRIVVKAIARDPSQRYATVDALAADLRRYLAGQPVSVRADSALYIIGKFILRHRVAVSAAAIVILAIVVSAVAVVWEAHEARIAAARAQAQALRAQAAQQFLIGMFEQLDPESSHGNAVSAHDLLDAGVKMLAQRRDDPVTLKSELLSTMVNLYFDIGDYARPLELARQAVALNDEPGMPAPEQARNLQNLGGMEYRDFKYDDALAHFRKGLALLDSSTDDGDSTVDRPKLANQLRAQIAMTLNAKGERTQAEASMKQLIADERARVGDDNQTVADAWDGLGQIQHTLRHYDDAAAAFDHATAIFRATKNDVMLAAALTDAGSMYADANRFADAERVLRESVAISQRLLGADHRDTIAALATLARAIEAQGRFDEAAPMHEKILARTQADFGPASAQAAQALYFLAQNQTARGRIADAIASYRSALAIDLALFGEDSVSVALARYTLADPLSRAGRYAEAETQVRQSLADITVARPNDVREIAMRHMMLGSIHRRAHRAADAVRELNIAIASLRQTLGDDDASVIFATTELGWTQLDSGDIASSTATMQRTVEHAHVAYAKGDYRNASPLIVLGRDYVAAGRAADAEPLLREAREDYAHAFGTNDHSIASADVALAEALLALGRREEAGQLAADAMKILANSEQDDTDLIARVRAVQSGKGVRTSRRPDDPTRANG